MKILCAVDFSEASIAAASYASGLAARLGARLELVFIQPLLVASVEADPTFSTALFEELRRQNEKSLSEWAARYKADSYHLRIGSVVEEIVAQAQDEHFDLIVCGPTGAGSTKAVLFGSTTQGLIHHSHTPVLVVPREAIFQSFNNVLIATDLEHLPHQLPAFFLKLCQNFKSQITLLYVAGIEEDLPQDKVDSALNWARRQFSGLYVTFQNYFSEDRILGIEETVSELEADLVVVVHQHRNFFQRIVHPAFSVKLARNLNKPLLVLEL